MFLVCSFTANLFLFGFLDTCKTSAFHFLTLHFTSFHILQFSWFLRLIQKILATILDFVLKFKSAMTKTDYLKNYGAYDNL